MRINPAILLTISACLTPSLAHATVVPPAIPEPTGVALFAAGAAVVALAVRLGRQR